jgi:5-(aminomethyl)-3-furanmethanol phosphate kinase
VNAWSRVTVVKLGGSYAASPHLRDWLEAITASAGHVVLVPGGGPFADAVRRAQEVMRFDDEAAHRLAVLAMEQFGGALAALTQDFVLAASLAAIRQVTRHRKVPVWSPTRMVLQTEDIPSSWEATSDSLAAWLAGRLGAKRLLLVKHTEPAANPLRSDELVMKGIVDPLFPRFLAASRAEAAIAGPADHATAAAALRKGELPGIRIDLR